MFIISHCLYLKWFDRIAHYVKENLTISCQKDISHLQQRAHRPPRHPQSVTEMGRKASWCGLQESDILLCLCGVDVIFSFWSLWSENGSKWRKGSRNLWRPSCLLGTGEWLRQIALHCTRGRWRDMTRGMEGSVSVCVCVGKKGHCHGETGAWYKLIWKAKMRLATAILKF